MHRWCVVRSLLEARVTHVDVRAVVCGRVQTYTFIYLFDGVCLGNCLLLLLVLVNEICN